MANSNKSKEKKGENKKDEDKEENKEDDSEHSDSWNDPDPTFQEIYKMVSKPSKLMRKATQIHDKIYLGARTEILDIEQLSNLKITHIIHAAEDSSDQKDGKDHKFWTNYFGNSFIYFGFVSMDDTKYEMINNHWPKCQEFLKNALCDKDTKVLIACRGGTNRSCTIIACCLIHFYKMDCKQAIKAIHDKKFPVLTNNSFIKQIIAFDQQKSNNNNYNVM